MFGSLRAAWSLIDPSCSGYVGRDQFVALLLTRKYPSGDMGARNVFFHLDTDEDGLVHLVEAEQELQDVNRLLDVQRGRSRVVTEEQEVGRTVNQRKVGFMDDFSEKLDAFENAAVWKSHSSLEDMRKGVIERLEQEDPLVAQFIHFLFDTYPSLKVAYAEMDIHRNNSLSKSEFTESFKTIRSKSGQRPIEVHVADLFHRVEGWCEEGAEPGKITVEDLLYTATCGDQILEYFGEFLSKEIEALGDCDEVTRRRALENVFVGKPGGGFGLQEFRIALHRLRYDDWYANELFARLDQDRSGEITLEEFTVCLEPDVNRGKGIRPKPVVPLGSKERRKQVLGGHSNIISNAKLGHIGRRRTIPQLDPKLVSDSASPPYVVANAASSASPVTPGSKIDNLSFVRSRLQRTGRSELAIAGRHVFSSSTERMPDLAVVRQGVAAFDDSLHPTRVSGV